MTWDILGEMAIDGTSIYSLPISMKICKALILEVSFGIVWSSYLCKAARVFWKALSEAAFWQQGGTSTSFRNVNQAPPKGT